MALDSEIRSDHTEEQEVRCKGEEIADYKHMVWEGYTAVDSANRVTVEVHKPGQVAPKRDTVDKELELELEGLHKLDQEDFAAGQEQQSA